jgi:hypothetical protein
MSRRIGCWIRPGVAGLLFLLSGGCASLTRPGAGPGGGVPGDSSGVAAVLPSRLERYLEWKRTVPDSGVAMRPFVAVMPFKDRSGFRKDIWALESEMARLLSAEMAASAEWRVVPYEVVDEVIAANQQPDLSQAVEFGRAMGADIVLRGTILDYNLGRLSVGDPLLGGYKSYRAVAKLQLQAVRVDDQSDIGTVDAERELVDRDLGLDLLGKPRKQDLEFTGLKDTPFNSEAFRRSVLGQATLETVQALLEKFAGLLHPQSLNLGSEPAEVLSVHGAEVYINLGSENGLRVGYRFTVFPGSRRVQEEGMRPEQQIGVVEVQTVIGARLSSVRVLEDTGKVMVGDRLQLMK